MDVGDAVEPAVIKTTPIAGAQVCRRRSERSGHCFDQRAGTQGEHEHWISRYTACFRFLEAVRERYRAVLDDLATFPVERVPELAREGDAIQWLRDWAKRQGRGLKCDLIVRVAAWTLEEWARNPEARAAGQNS